MERLVRPPLPQGRLGRLHAGDRARVVRDRVRVRPSPAQGQQSPYRVIDASRGGTTVETWTQLSRLRAMESELVGAKLAEWHQKIAEWDAEKDLAQRIKSNRAWVERQTKAGKAVPEDRKQDPTDLRPGPIADHNHPGHCYAGLIAPLAGLAVKGAIFPPGIQQRVQWHARGEDVPRMLCPR